MYIATAYARIPFIRERLKDLSYQIHSQRRSVETLKAWGLDHELYLSARDWLEMELNLWGKITGGKAC